MERAVPAKLYSACSPRWTGLRLSVYIGVRLCCYGHKLPLSLMSEDPAPPSLPWRASSATVIGIIGTLTRAFMHGLNTQEGHGHEGFLRLLDERADIGTRQRGLITGEPAST